MSDVIRGAVANGFSGFCISWGYYRNCCSQSNVTILLLLQYKKLCVELDEGRVPKPLHLLVTNNDAD